MELNDLISIILSINAFTCLFLGLVLYLHGGSLSSKLFAAVAVSAGLWIADVIVQFYQYSAAGYAVPPYLLSKISLAIAIIIFYLFFLFSHTFPNNRLIINRFLLYVFTSAAVIAIVFSFITGGVLLGEKFSKGDYLSLFIHGSGYNFFYAPLIFTLLFWGTGRLVATYLKANDSDKLRLRLIILGSLVSGFVGITYDVIAPHLPRNVGSLPVGHFGVFIFVSMSSYAILKHHLFSVKVIATELLTFSIWTFLLIRLFLAGDGLEIAINGTLLIIVVIFGALLIKSVLNEVHEREDLEKMSTSLEYLKSNLEKKVIEQTEEVKNAYEIEKKARIDIEEINDNKDKFILATQHHLRTPLTIISGYLSSLRAKKDLGKDTSEMFNRMSQSTEVISKSVNDLLRATEIKVNKQDGS